MMTCSKCHFGVYLNGVFGSGETFVEGGFDRTFVIYNHRFESRFPYGIPVLLLYIIKGVLNFEQFAVEYPQFCLQVRLVEELVRDLGFEVWGLSEETLKA